MLDSIETEMKITHLKADGVVDDVHTARAEALSSDVAELDTLPELPKTAPVANPMPEPATGDTEQARGKDKGRTRAKA